MVKRMQAGITRTSSPFERCEIDILLYMFVISGTALRSVSVHQLPCSTNPLIHTHSMPSAAASVYTSILWHL